MNIQINNNLERKAYCTEELASYVSFIGVRWDGVNFPSKVLIFCSSARVTYDKTTRTIYKYLGDGHDLLLPYLIKVQTTFKSNHITPGLGDHHQVLIQHCIARLKSFTVKNN